MSAFLLNKEEKYVDKYDMPLMVENVVPPQVIELKKENRVQKGRMNQEKMEESEVHIMNGGLRGQTTNYHFSSD